MKRKLTLILLTCVACLALVGGIVLTACKDKGATYAIEWKLDEHVTVVAEGYDKLPTAVKEGTEIVFTATPDNGYEITSVAPSSIKKDGEKYKFTVADKDVTVTIKVSKAIDSVTATLKDATKVYYAGDTITADDLNVKVNYKAGDSETVTSGISIAYATGDALSIGDKKITVSYRGHNSDVTLPLLEDEDGVVALVTIDPDGGEIAMSYLMKLWALPHYNLDIDIETGEGTGIVTFTHKGDLEEDILLPLIGSSEDLEIESEVTKGEDGDYNLRGWSDGSKMVTKISKDSKVSVTYTLVNDPNLLVISKVYYQLDEGVAYLIIEGTFKAANKAYLFLYEGNDEVELKGNEITGTKGDDFKLKFDMRKLVDANYEGKWMDLKFRAEFGERVETQQINLEDYAAIEDFVDVDQSMKFIYKDAGYKVGFRTHTPNGTTQKNLKVVYENYAGYEVTDVKLVEKEGKPYVVLEGIYELSIESAEALENFVKGISFDWQNNDGANGGGWGTFITDNSGTTYEVVYNASGTSTFKLTIDISVLKDGDVAFSHFAGANLVVPITEKTLTIGTVTYTVKNWTGWGSQLVCIFVEDSAAKAYNFDNNAAKLVEEDGHVYIVVEGTYQNYELDELKAAMLGVEKNACDAENESSSTDKTDLSEGLTVTAGQEAGTFVAKIDITDLKSGRFWIHFAGKDTRDQSTTAKVEYNGRTYAFIADQKSWGTAYLLEVTGTALGSMTVATTDVKLEVGQIDSYDVAYLVFSGTWSYENEHTYNEEQDLAALKKLFTAACLQTEPGWAYLNGASGSKLIAPDTLFVIHADGKFDVKIALLGAKDGSFWYLHYQHEGKTSDAVLYNAYTVGTSSVEASGQTFAIYDNEGGTKSPGSADWLKQRLIVTVSGTSTIPVMEVETTAVRFGAEQLDSDNEVPVLVFSGNWSYSGTHTFNEAKDLLALKALFSEYSVQTDIGYAYLNGASDSNKMAANTIFAIYENGTFEVKIALNGANNDTIWYLHYKHVGRNNGDVGWNTFTVDSTPVTVGGQTFSFFDTEEGTKGPEGHEGWLKDRLIVVVSEYVVPEPDGSADNPYNLAFEVPSITVNVPAGGKVYYFWQVMGLGTVKVSFLSDAENIKLEVYNSSSPQEVETYQSVSESGLECTVEISGYTIFAFSTIDGQADEYTIGVTEEQDGDDEEGTENNPKVIEFFMEFCDEIDDAWEDEVWYTYTVKEGGETLYFSWGEGTAIDVLYDEVYKASSDEGDAAELKGGLAIEAGKVIKIKVHSGDFETTNLSFTISLSPIEEDDATTYEPKYVMQNGEPTGNTSNDVVGEEKVENGKWGIWWAGNGWNCGDEVNMTSKSVDADTKTITVSYTGGSVDYSVQLFYKDDSIPTGQNYKITLKVNVTAQLQVKINGVVKTLTAGDNDVEIDWNGAGTTFSMQLYGLNGMEGVDSMTATISNIVYTVVD